jgi:hypothetical protein
MFMPTENKIYDVKDGFYEELEFIFDKFTKYHMKMLVGVLSQFLFINLYNNCFHCSDNPPSFQIKLTSLRISESNFSPLT